MSDLAALVRRYVERYNANDVDGMLDCCSDDVVFETVTNPGGSIRLTGKTEMREVIEATTRAGYLPEADRLAGFAHRTAGH